MNQPFTQHHHGHSFRCWRRGGQPAVLLLHGFLGNARTFDRLVLHLDSFPTVWGINIPGHDLDHPLPCGCDFATALAGVAAAVDALPEQPLRLAGYSLGARIALALLAQAPERFTGATLIGVNPGLSSPDERSERRRTDAGWARRLREEGLPAFLERWEAQPLFADQRHWLPELQASQRALREKLDPEQLARALETWGLAEMPDFWPVLPRLPIPVQLVVGAQDDKFRRLSERMLERFPRATLSIVPDTGHNVVLEAPEAVARLMEKTT